jgi:N-acetylmuramoyl-L-alanine amidase
MKVEYLVIHHSFTKDGLVVDWKAIRDYHINTNGWDDIGYHYGIEKVNGDYVIISGRSEDTNGAHTKEQGMNSKSLGICVIGNYDLGEPDKRAFDLLVILCVGLCKKYKLTADKIRTHHEYANYKTCPGSKFPMDKLRNEADRMLKEG